MKKLILTILISASLIFTITPFTESAQVDKGLLNGKKIVMIIPKRLFHDIELDWLTETFSRENADIIIASSTMSESYSSGGKGVKPDILINDIDVKEIDAVIFIGGAGCYQYLTDYTAHKKANQIVDQGKLLVAIQLAPRILAEAGLLTGKRATCASPAKMYLKDKGVIVTDNNMERDGNIFTAVGASAVKELGEAIVSALRE